MTLVKLMRNFLRGRLKSATYFVAITQTSFQRTSSTPPFGLSLNASYLALFKRPLNKAANTTTRHLLLLSLCLGPMGCATIMKEKEERILINSQPSGVRVDLGQQVCHTPCTLEFPRGQNITAVFTRHGFESQTHHINGHSLDGWLLGNLAYLFLFPIAVGIDFYTGYAYDYGPDQLNVEMKSIEKPTVTPIDKINNKEKTTQ